jgi:hypothetical protein
MFLIGEDALLIFLAAVLRVFRHSCFRIGFECIGFECTEF